jgi:hypothetical protein
MIGRRRTRVWLLIGVLLAVVASLVDASAALAVDTPIGSGTVSAAGYGSMRRLECRPV